MTPAEGDSHDGLPALPRLPSLPDMNVEIPGDGKLTFSYVRKERTCNFIQLFLTQP